MDTVRYYIHKIKILLLCSMLFVPAMAQKKLVFINASKQKVIELKPGHRVALLYTGYRGQVEFAREMVSDITDSTITIGLDMGGMFGASKPGKHNRMTYKTIAIKDIKGFRRMTLGRQIAKSTFAAAGVVGSFYFLKGVYSSDMSNFSSFAISVGVGLGLYGLNNLIFPENIKYYMEDGWTVIVSDP